jgi:hypothetical protein
MTEPLTHRIIRAPLCDFRLCDITHFRLCDITHSHVRHYQMQANEFVACEQALVLGSSRQGRRHGRRNDG